MAVNHVGDRLGFGAAGVNHVGDRLGFGGAGVNTAVILVVIVNFDG